MRVAVVSDNFHPEIGGIQDSIEALATELGRRGHSVDFYAPRYAPRDYRMIGAPVAELDLGPNVTIRRLRSLPVPSSTRQSRLVIPIPMRAMRAFRRSRPDIVHSQTFFGLGLEAQIAARRLGIPIIGTNHTAVRAFAPFLPVGAAWAEFFVLWYYNQCDMVTAPSRSVFDELGAGRLRRPLEIISNPIDTVTFRPAPAGAGADSADAPRPQAAGLVYAGRLAAEKNIDTILRALALLHRQGRAIGLALAGHGGAEPQLRALASELGVDRQIAFTGTLAKSRLALLFQGAEIFVNMSVSETQSMALLQAMACGLPAIGANCRALPEFITASHGFVVEPRDHAALAERIDLLLADSRRRAILGQNAVAFARRFRTEAVADRWERTYRALIGRATTRA